MNNFLLIFNLFIISGTIEAEKILFIVPGGTFSHKNNIWPWVLALASEKGHEVTFISSFDKKIGEHPNIKDYSPKALVDFMSSSYSTDRLQARREGKEADLWEMGIHISIGLTKVVFNSTEDEILNKLINEWSFDLIIANAVFGEAGFLLAHHLKTKFVISDSSTLLPWYNDIYGVPSQISWIPDMMTKYESFPFSLMDKIRTLYINSMYFYKRNTFLYPSLEKFYQERFKLDDASVPSILEIEKNAKLVFVNTHYSFDYAWSYPAFVIPIGGMQCFQKDTKEIPKIFADFLDKSDNGVIVIAFGSTIELSKMPEHYKTIFFESIRKFKDINFLMKWKGDLPENFPSNLFVADWLPQKEILGHKNIRAFITHSGSNSLIEATYLGIPLIVLPLFADQDYNALRIETFEVGIRLEAQDLTLEIMQTAIENILTDKKYKINMERHSRLFKDREMSPIDLAVFWTEWALRNDDGGERSPLKPLSMYQTWYERRFLDIYAAILFVFIITPLLIILIINRLFFRNKKC